MAFWKMAVSSVAPSPLAPSARMLTQVLRGGSSDIRVVQAVRKYLHLVNARWGCHLLSALAEGGEDGHALADDVLEVDLGPRIIFQADDDGWAGNVFHPAILHPDLVGGARVEGDCRRNVTE